MIDLSLIPILAACSVMTWLAFSDLNGATIPNLGVALLLIAGVAQLPLIDNPTWHIVAGTVAFVSSFFLWQTDNLGGGDVKMITMVALLLGPWTFMFLFCLGVCAVLIALSRGAMPRLWRKRRDIPAATAAAPAFVATILIAQATGGV